MKNSKMNERLKLKTGKSIPLGEVGGALTRKEFLKTLARYGLLALIVALGVFLMTNRKTKVEEECNNNFVCGNCKKKNGCKIDKSKKGR
jgi:hypothetical protein